MAQGKKSLSPIKPIATSLAPRRSGPAATNPSPAKPAVMSSNPGGARASTPGLIARHVKDGIGITLWVRTDAPESLLRIDFPTSAGKRGKVVVPRGMRRRPADILRKIEDAGGELPWKDPISKLGDLMMTTGLQPHFLTPTPGWHRNVFVPAQGQVKTRDDQGRECFIRVRFDAGPTPFGHCRGTANEWRATVGRCARQSTMLSFSVMTAFAASLAAHARLPEGVLFNIFADSSNGKTTCARVAMSVAGNPADIGSYHASPRGLEEAAALSNGYPMLTDDMEKISDDPKKVLQHVNHVVTGGKSKRLSQVTKDQLPPLEWTCFGLSTSPQSMAETMRRAGKSPTLGDRVRFPDIPFPTDNQGGLFDLVDGGAPLTLEQNQAWLNEVEKGIAANYGHVFEEWRRKILRRIKTEDVAERVDAFRRGLPNGNKAEGRLLQKFALVAVAGDLASQHGILDWPVGHSQAVVERVWGWARQELRNGRDDDEQPWLVLKAALADEKQVVRLEVDDRFPGQVDDLVGIRRERQGVEVVALFGDTVRKLMGGEFDRLIQALRGKGALVTEPGRTDALTLQVPIHLAGGTKPLRPRLYIVRAEALDAVVNMHCQFVAGSRSATLHQAAPVRRVGPGTAQPDARGAKPRQPTQPSTPSNQREAPVRRRGRCA